MKEVTNFHAGGCVILGMVVALWCWAILAELRADWFVEVEGFSKASGRMAIYVDRGEGFSEDEVQIHVLKGGDFSKRFQIRRGGVRGIRWDGLDRPGEIRVERLAIRMPDRILFRVLSFDQAVATSEVSIRQADGGEVRVLFEGRDGWVAFPLPKNGESRFRLPAALPSLLLGFMVGGLSLLWNRHTAQPRGGAID
ncbi:MAG: hypothetical protein ACFCU4_06710 [Puniceicoccaceae bacterium]